MMIRNILKLCVLLTVFFFAACEGDKSYTCECVVISDGEEGPVFQEVEAKDVAEAQEKCKELVPEGKNCEIIWENK